MPGDSSRFDYSSLDPTRHLLFIAHLGAGQIIEVNTATGRIVRVIDRVHGVHGVLVVPSLDRVHATATDVNQVLTLDEATGAVLARAPTGDYPDGLAYDPDHQRVWVTDESGGSGTVITTAGTPVGSVSLGGDAGNVTRRRERHPDDPARRRTATRPARPRPPRRRAPTWSPWTPGPTAATTPSPRRPAAAPRC